MVGVQFISMLQNIIIQSRSILLILDLKIVQQLVTEVQYILNYILIHQTQTNLVLLIQALKIVKLLVN